MILVFDVGNTELTVGLFSEAELRGHWRVMTDVARTPDEFGVLLRSLLAARGFAAEAVESVAIGSVVPRVTGPLAAACTSYFEVGEPLIVDARVALPITLAVSALSYAFVERPFLRLRGNYHRDAEPDPAP